MNEPSMALVPNHRRRRHHHGCVGLLFHLLDWNRRFSRRRSSPNRLAPPPSPHPKLSSDDKMPIPKLLMMAEEKRRSPGTDAPRPGLVARLMGLETMPEPSRDRPRRAVDSAVRPAGNSGESRHDLNLEVGRGRVEDRPQKLRRIGVLEKCEAEVRKQQRKMGRKGSGRLMEAAVRILEPGLQRRTRRRSIGYHGHKEGEGCGYVGSCRSCGSLVEVVDLKVELEVLEDAGKVGLSKNSRGSGDNAGELKLKVGDDVSGGKVDRSMRSEVVVQANAGRSVREEWRNRSGVRKFDKMPARDKVVPNREPSKMRKTRRDSSDTSSSSKDFIGSGKRLNTQVPPAPARTGSRLTESRKVEAKAVAQKRRVSGASQVVSLSGRKVDMTTKRNVKHSIGNGKAAGCASSVSMSRIGVSGSSKKQGLLSSSGSSKDSSVLAFTFNAPFTQEVNVPSSDSVEEVGNSARNLCDGDVSLSRKSAVDSVAENAPSAQRVTGLTGDELSALLEQKIRELNSLQQAVSNGENVGKSTASILEELISALTTGGPIHQKKFDDKCDSDGVQMDSHSCGTPDRFCGADSHPCKVDAQEISRVYSPTAECSQRSPLSILEASFSTGSSLSESFFSTSGHELPYGLPDEPWERSQLWDPDADFMDSATSGNLVVFERSKVSPYLDNISIMYGTSECFGFSKFMPNFARKVISNTEKLLKNFSENQDCGGTDEFQIDTLLLDFLELLSSEFTATPIGSSNLAEAKDNKDDQSSHRSFLFDCIIESLNTICIQRWSSNYISRMKPSSILTIDELMSKIHADILRCRDLAGKFVDEIIREELKYPTEKWIEVEAEMSEAGVDLEHELLQGLVNEMVLDLLPR